MGTAEQNAYVDAQAWTLFREQLSKSLADPDTKRTLATMAEAEVGVDVDALQDEVAKNWDAVKHRLKTALERWRRAEEKLAEAKGRLEERTFVSWVSFVGRITAAIGVVGAAVVVYLAIRDDNLSRLFLLFLLAYVAIPWLLLLAYRQGVEYELAMPFRSDALKAAKKSFQVALRDQVTVAIREAINGRSRSFDSEFQIFDKRGLRELVDPEREVPTIAGDELGGLIASLDSGSIGLAGPRGAGKTTLIDSFAVGRSVSFQKERIGLVVSAPVKYDARDFVLHLFASLCERVLLDSRSDGLALVGSDALKMRSRISWAKRTAVAALVLAGVGVAMIAFNRTAPEGPTETGLSLLALAVAAGYVALLVWLVSRRRAERETPNWWERSGDADTAPQLAEDRPPRPLESQAIEHLEAIRYQQSLAKGWSSGIRLPFGISFGEDSTTTMARRSWSFPEAVEEFRRFAATVADGRYVVVGIDELDKMGSDEEAREFLNNVKGVFGVTGCYYLVSVSEEAMSNFERRGLSIRDVFDSSFDAIQRVGYLELAETRAVLESRVTGLPVPFQCFCHSMAGGLPRDLIRVTRELVHQHEVLSVLTQAESTGAQPPRQSLRQLCDAVLHVERKAKVDAAVAESRGMQGEHREWLVRWLDLQTEDSLNVARLHERSREFARWGGMLEHPADDADAHSARAIAWQVATFNYYAASVSELFGSGLVAKLLPGPDTPGGIDHAGIWIIEGLAIARQQFSVSPSLAWGRLNAVRDATRLEAWENPQALTAAARNPGTVSAG